MDAAENPCVKPASTDEKTNVLPADSQPLVQRPLYVDEPGEVVSKLQLESVASSDDIRNALKDETLQKIIFNVNHSSDPESVSTASSINPVKWENIPSKSAISSDRNSTKLWKWKDSVY
ncbi:hypothetical protein Tsubulata_033757 [Turnera subulata]|uniref:Uncharacterized protein n=1 Tax=Turnera subulata TaxID=218843 RepID=A0A9Q0JPK6_9ROSI|nr:hypothetical protein Tsubulata_033757 [Turnera subulata]